MLTIILVCPQQQSDSRLECGGAFIDSLWQTESRKGAYEGQDPQGGIHDDGYSRGFPPSPFGHSSGTVASPETGEAWPAHFSGNNAPVESNPSASPAQWSAI